MGQLVFSTGVRIVVCATLAVVLVRVLTDGRQERWAPVSAPEYEECPGVATGPESRASQTPQWLSFVDELAQEVADADDKEGFDVLFYGDSITEHWRGSEIGGQQARLQPTHEIFETRFNSNYTSEVLAVAGDQVGNLWWRLLNGEVPKKQPKAIVMLIGTNDLTADDCDQSQAASLAGVVGIVDRVQNVLLLLRDGLPDAHIILLGILPRDAVVTAPTHAYQWPNRMSDAIMLTNFEYEAVAALDDHIHFLDCGALFTTQQGLNATLLPDGLHPSPPGMNLLGGCLQPFVDELVHGLPPSAAMYPAGN